MKWRSIKSAPQDETEFQGWLVNEHGTGFWYPYCRFNKDGCFETYDRTDYDEMGWEYCGCKPTHWMPQPDSPK